MQFLIRKFVIKVGEIDKSIIYPLIFVELLIEKFINNKNFGIPN